VLLGYVRPKIKDEILGSKGVHLMAGKFKLSLFARFVIIVTVVISATDLIIFYVHGFSNPTLGFIILVIIVTIVPIVVNLWYWLIFKPRAKGTRQSVILWLCVGFALMVCWLLVLSGIIA